MSQVPSPVLYIDRDGTLIAEPDDFQIDSYAKLRFVDGVIPALLRLRDAGYRLVMITNQDGLGGPGFAQADFDGPHALMLQVFSSQGVVFDEVLIDTSMAADNLSTRKPGIGMVLHHVQDRTIDWSRSAMVGDRETDSLFAGSLGIRAFQLRTAQFGGQWDWPAIAHALVDIPRTATVIRNSRETQVTVEVDLDRIAEPDVATGLGFFDHMLQQLGKHGGFALRLRCTGDLHVDEHHTVEDSALALGQTLREALGDKRGIARYGFTLPMDESLASAALDLSGRAWFEFDGRFVRERVGELSTELVPHFFRSLCEGARMTLNLKVDGDNDHHKIEACFKVVARALRQAIRRGGNELPTTKGML